MQLTRKVIPRAAEAWIEAAKRDPKDGRVGLVGYEIKFNPLCLPLDATAPRWRRSRRTRRHPRVSS